ncbi:unnamed protein product, partial [Phaeothamnion confervicola]
MKDLGRVHTLLGILVQQDLKAGTIRLSQPHYIDDLLARFRMSDAWPVQTPSCPGAPPRSAARGPATTAEAAKMAGNPLRELVGAVLYLAVTTRPDIFDEVRSLTRTVHNPRLPDWLAALWLLRYLKGTREKGLLFSRSAAARMATPGAAIGYADADWARDIDRRRSVGAYVFLRSGAAISWRSKMQDCTAASTCEAEYVAAAYAVQHALWLRRLARGLGLQVTA